MKNLDYMIHNSKLICILDTNVIHPIVIRDILFWFASYDLYIPKWSKHIFDEWKTLMKRKNVPKFEIERRISKAHQAFPDAKVKNYESLVENITLPDLKDRHIVAAAIKSKANIIITHNLKDFPNDYLAIYRLEARSPDDFLSEIIELNPSISVKAFKSLVLNRNNPSINEFEILEILKNNHLMNTADCLYNLL